MSCPGNKPSTATAPVTVELKTADGSVIDTPDIQMIHQQAYDGLQKAFEYADKFALAATDTTFIANLISNWSANVNTSTSHDLKFYWVFADTLDSSAVIPGYTDTWPYLTKPAPTTAAKFSEFFGSFFKFAMSRLPRKAIGQQASFDDYILDNSSKPMQCAGPDGTMYKTYYDFHVARLAQLVMSKVMFSLAMSAASVQINVSPTSIGGATPPAAPNKANLDTIQAVVDNIEDSLSAALGDNTMSPNDLQNPENIYLTIKSISSANLSQSQQVAALQSAIDQRRTTLQTALNAEMQVDGIVWWSGFWMWMWVAFFIIGVVLIVHSLLVGQYLLIFGAFAIIVLIQILITVLNWFGYNGTLWDISGVNDSIAMSLGIPNLSNF
jgi:hypothetical protein